MTLGLATTRTARSASGLCQPVLTFTCQPSWKPACRPKAGVWRATKCGSWYRFSPTIGWITRYFVASPSFLDPGDLVVVNTSGTLKAALPARATTVRRCCCTCPPAFPGERVVEVRQARGRSEQAVSLCCVLRNPGSTRRCLRQAGTASPRQLRRGHAGRTRLWIARLHLPCPWQEYLERFGAPIRYKYVAQPWPADSYQNVYATEQGSAEMPSAGGHLPSLSPGWWRQAFR